MDAQQHERERLARWLRNGESYDDWTVGMEPIVGDRSWAKKKASEEAVIKEELN